MRWHDETFSVHKNQMPTREEFIAEVDRLLEVQKTLAGTESIEWQDGRTIGSKVIKIPIAVAGIQFGTQLVVNAYPQEPGRFSFLLVHKIAISRLDVTDDGEIHGNFQALPNENLPPLVNGPHFHEWALNRRLIEGSNKLQKLPLARPFYQTRNFNSALRWFCAEVKIELPFDLALELPPREQLF